MTAPTTDKSHLLRFGYAPGGYTHVKCNDCKKSFCGDPYARRCETCAATLYSQVTSVEAVTDRHRTTPILPEVAMKAAEAEFATYFMRNYPGPDTVIHKPEWHAPKLFYAAKRAILWALESSSAGLPRDPTDEMVDAALAIDWENEHERATVINIWHAMTAKLPTLQPSAARELALEEIIALCKDYAEDSQPHSEYRLACNDIIEAIQERRALSSLDHADAGKVEGDGKKWPMREIVAKAIAYHSVGDPHAKTIRGDQRWEWFLEEADKFIFMFGYNLPALPSAPSEGAK